MDQIEVKHRLGKVGSWLNRPTDFPEDRHLLCRFAIAEFFKLPCIELYMANEKEGKFKELAKEAYATAKEEYRKMKTFKQFVLTNDPSCQIAENFRKIDQKEKELVENAK